MIILPAIDILNKQPVRLYQGDYNQKEVVGQSIVEIALTFEQQGASYLHLVDLDGAKDGKLVNQQCIIDVVNAVSIPVEIGGGIRSLEAITHYIEQGVARVILGTSAMEDPNLLQQAIALYGAKIAVGIDCKDEYVYGRGWLEASNLHYLDFAQTLQEQGVQTIIVTDISKDGTLLGPNVEMLKRLQEVVDMQIIASGGIKDLSHIQQLLDIHIYGAITGKAMYHQTLDLKEAIALCEKTV